MTNPEGWIDPEDHEAWAARFKKLRSEAKHPRSRWLLLIKELRVTHQCSILEAECIAVANPHRRRWAEQAINAGPPCRSRAVAHMRHYGALALIEKRDGSFFFKK